MTETSETPARPRVIGRAITSIVLAFFYAYPTWTAIGNLINLPGYYARQFGAAPDQVPWVLLWAGVALPPLIFALAVALGWRRGSGAIALLLTTGFALVSALGLDIIALQTDHRMRLVVEFLTNGG